MVCCGGLLDWLLPTKKPIAVVLLGLDGAGKTSILQRIVRKEGAASPRPTNGFSLERARLGYQSIHTAATFTPTHRKGALPEEPPSKGAGDDGTSHSSTNNRRRWRAKRLSHVDTILYDIGGAPAFRSIWTNYLSDVHGCIYVLDWSTPARWQESVKALSRVYSDPRMWGKPLLILVNKVPASAFLRPLAHPTHPHAYHPFGRVEAESGVVIQASRVLGLADGSKSPSTSPEGTPVSEKPGSKRNSFPLFLHLSGSHRARVHPQSEALSSSDGTPSTARPHGPVARSLDPSAPAPVLENGFGARLYDTGTFLHHSGLSDLLAKLPPALAISAYFVQPLDLVPPLSPREGSNAHRVKGSGKQDPSQANITIAQAREAEAQNKLQQGLSFLLHAIADRRAELDARIQRDMERQRREWDREKLMRLAAKNRRLAMMGAELGDLQGVTGEYAPPTPPGADGYGLGASNASFTTPSLGGQSVPGGQKCRRSSAVSVESQGGHVRISPQSTVLTQRRRESRILTNPPSNEEVETGLSRRTTKISFGGDGRLHRADSIDKKPATTFEFSLI